MLRIMSFLEEATGKELVLPVTPAKYFWRHPNGIETVQLDQLGEINLPGGSRMGDCTLEDVLLPAQLYPFCVPGPGRPLTSTCMTWRCGATGGPSCGGSSPAPASTPQ